MNRIRLTAPMVVLACAGMMDTAMAQSISVVSGNGQVESLTVVQPQLMVVQVTGSSGAPAAGQTVNWAVTSGPPTASLLTTGGTTGSTTTDQNGQAQIAFTFGGIPQQTSILFPFVQSTITATLASSPSATATFTITALVPGTAGTIPPSIQFSVTDNQGNQTSLPTLRGAAGSRGTPFIVHVFASNGFQQSSIPNAAVQLLNFQDPSTGPAIACVGSAQSGVNTVLTDSNGNATCTPQFGGVPGQGQGVIAIGGVLNATNAPTGPWLDPNAGPIQASGFSLIPFSFTVTAAAANSIKVVSGSNQSATAGQSLANPLVAEVDDSSGKPVAGIPVTWKASPANAVNIASTTTTTSDSNGRVSANVSLTGAATGTVQVTVSLNSDSTKTATFNITATPLVTITGITIFSGNNQSAPVGTAFSQPLVVQVSTNAGAASNVTVQFAATGPVTLSATTATTDSNGRAQVNATAGTVTGGATVTASVAGSIGTGTQTFNLTVVPQAPVFTAANFVNGADFQSNSLSPCSLGAIQANPGGLGATGVAPGFPGFPLSTTNVKLTFGTLNAPILSVGTNGISNRDQIIFQVPCGVQPGSSVPATLSIGGGTSNVNLNIQTASPGVFTTLNSDNTYRALLVRPDGSFVSLENPARAGETEVAYVTGLGPTTPSIATPTAFNGAAVPPPSSQANQINALVPNGTVIVGMAGQGVPLNYARLSEDLPGVFVVSFTIPSDMQTGSNVTFSIGLLPSGATSAIYSNTTKIPVQ